MEYRDAASFLDELRRFALRPGTDATRALLAELGDPHADVACVQIAGSNGKGSTAKMVEGTLREAGLDVGLYTSPHLDSVHERIRVNGRPLSEAALVAFVEAAREYITDEGATNSSPTFFETLTAMALWEFDRRDVDVAVLEVGIGGRHDATSVVDPIASAVTSVTLEHTGILGDTVAEIARDKAHVAPADRPLVTAATGDALDGVRAVAGEVVTVDLVADESAGSDATGDPDSQPDVAVTYRGRDGLEAEVTIEDGASLDVRIPLLGPHQAVNAGVAATLSRQVIDAVGADAGPAAIATGLRNAHWPGRFEVLDRDPLVVLDGAHNPGGIEQVARTLASFAYDELHVVTGAMVDKDHVGIAGALPEPEHVVACQPAVDRAETEEVVAAAFERATDAEVEQRHDVPGALDVALEAADEDDCVLVTGSLYAVAEARRRWTRSIVPKDVDTLARSTKVLDAAHVSEPGVWRMRAKGVHRVLHTRVRPKQAQYIKEDLLSLGGECATSGVHAPSEDLIDVVAMGTLSQFKRLVESLRTQPYGLSAIAEEFAEALDIEQPAPASRGYPWEDDTAIMGILNITPDSFHDGGEYNAVEDARERAERMVDAGVAILDVGGESTRPGGEPVPAEDERERVVPVIEALADLDAWISIDTRKPGVARAALDAGADIINDVSGLEDPEMRHLAAEYDVPVVVMHSFDLPVDPDREIHYDDVVEDVVDDLSETILLAEKAGLDRDQLLVDPGIGFGKRATESFEMLGRLGEFDALGCPILVGHSHKSMFGLVGEQPGDCLEATIAGTAIATERGADVIRVHDPAENLAAVRVARAVDDPDAFTEE
jgi:dihydropteroate synthase